MHTTKDNGADVAWSTSKITIEREVLQRIMNQALEYRRHTIALEAANKRLIELLIQISDGEK